jgi:two-component system, OmpR family, phosphate regulon sensor histidine kinase PhoR
MTPFPPEFDRYRQLQRLRAIKHRFEEHRQMETIGLSNPLPSALCTGWVGRDVGIAMNQDAGSVNSNFFAALLAIAGHDLRQPLQVITSAHDVLARLVDGERREELAQAEDATAQLASMLGQLVEALQLHELSRDGFHVPVRVRPVLDELAAEFAQSARQKGVSLRVTSARGTALSHPVLLTGMLRNLIRNAIDYTPPGGSVFIASRRFGSELRIEVRDTGVGIRANALSMIFRAFQRVDESRRDGLGLGLFIVKHAADVLGHRVEVGSVEGRGSSFTVVAEAVCEGGRKSYCEQAIDKDCEGALLPA